jgi:hypothetical protein
MTHEAEEEEEGWEDRERVTAVEEAIGEEEGTMARTTTRPREGRLTTEATITRPTHPTEEVNEAPPTHTGPEREGQEGGTATPRPLPEEGERTRPETRRRMGSRGSICRRWRLRIARIRVDIKEEADHMEATEVRRPFRSRTRAIQATMQATEVQAMVRSSRFGFSFSFDEHRT